MLLGSDLPGGVFAVQDTRILSPLVAFPTHRLVMTDAGRAT